MIVVGPVLTPASIQLPTVVLLAGTAYYVCTATALLASAIYAYVLLMLLDSIVPTASDVLYNDGMMHRSTTPCML